MFCEAISLFFSSLSDLSDEINEESCLFCEAIFLFCESSLCSSLLLFSLCSCLKSFSLFTCTSIELYERNGQEQYSKGNTSVRFRRISLNKC